MLAHAGVDVDREDGEEEQVTEGVDGEVVGSELATTHAMRYAMISDEEELEGAGEQPGPQVLTHPTFQTQKLDWAVGT